MSRVAYRFFIIGILAVTMFSSGMILFISPIPNQPSSPSSSASSFPSAFATFPGENGKIAFSSNRDGGNYEIYVMNADGSEQTRLTNNTAAEFYPDWSPDGEKIAFTSDRDGNSEIYVMNADGSEQTRLTDNNAWDAYPSWSPDGEKIAFTSDRDGYGEIYIMDSDGSGQTNISNNPAPDYNPSWSPDGTKIAFVSEREGFRASSDIYVMNAVDGSGQTRLTPFFDEQFDPDWSPDGTKIAFVTAFGPNTGIRVIDSGGGGSTTPIDTDDVFEEEPSWSPDGEKIVFARINNIEDEPSEIYIINSDGSEQTNISNNPAWDTNPDWGPVESSPPEEDTTAPVIIVPDEIKEEATGPDGAVVSFEVSAEDDVDGPTDVTCDYNSGDIFPIGETVVICSAEDLVGNRAEESFTITVQDTTAPDVEITQASDRRNGRAIEDGSTTNMRYIEITFQVSDAVGIESTECSLDGQPFTSCTSPIVYDRLSRSNHEFTVRSTDAAGNIGEDSFTWTVRNPSAAAPGRQ